MRAFLIFLLVSLSVPVAFAADHKELKAFPKAKEGMERVVIVLPHKERGEEDSFKVELIPGKEMMSDGVNRMRLGISLISQPLKGWGYTFYEMKGKAIAMSTLMAPPRGAKKVKKFISGQSLMVRYNSRLPIVVYVPKGIEVRYRIWQAPELLSKADKG